MNLLKVITGAFKPVTDFIDDSTLSKEEKKKFEVQMAQIQENITTDMIAYEKTLVKAQASAITAEAAGHSMLQRNWRPITMLTFLGLVILDSFGVLPNPMAPEAWNLLKIGLGGYVAGRSMEKIVPNVISAVRNKAGDFRQGGK